MYARGSGGETVLPDDGAAFRVNFRGSETPYYTMTDFADGRCGVQWVATVSGEYEISVTLRGEHIAGSPFIARADHGVITSSQCEARVARIDPASSTASRPHFG